MNSQIRTELTDRYQELDAHHTVACKDGRLADARRLFGRMCAIWTHIGRRCT